MPSAPAQQGLYCNATLVFGTYTGDQIKGFNVVRRCDPNFSAADLSSRITYVAAKNCIDILTVQMIDPRILGFVQGDTGQLTLTAKTATGNDDLVFSGPATVIGVEGAVEFANVESPCAITFAVISTDGQAPDLAVE